MSDDHLMKLIGYNVQGTAEWRRRKAEEFPEDTRNLKAAEELERFAAEIETLEHSEIHQQICDVQERIDRIDDGDLWTEVSQAESEALRSINESHASCTPDTARPISSLSPC
jgi:hypothetical protein